MTSCVLGKETIDELKAMVIKKFEKIENKNLPFKSYDKVPFQEKELQKEIKIGQSGHFNQN